MVLADEGSSPVLCLGTEQVVFLWGKHRVTGAPGVTGAGKTRRALCCSQSANLHGRERGYFPARELNHRRIGVSNSILPAGQQQNLNLTTSLSVFSQSLMSLLRDATEMQRSGFAGGAGSQQRMHRVCAYLSHCKFGRTEGNAPGDLRPGAPGSPGQRETLGRKE